MGLTVSFYVLQKSLFFLERVTAVGEKVVDTQPVSVHPNSRLSVLLLVFSF